MLPLGILDRLGMAQSATATPGSSSTAPMFLRRLYTAEEERRQARSASRGYRERSESGESDATNLEDGHPPPPLSYSSSSASATSSEAPYELALHGLTELREKENSKNVQLQQQQQTPNNIKNNSFGYITDVESIGYSSGDSRSTSPASKSAFSSPAFPFNASAFSTTSSHWQSPSFPGSSPSPFHHYSYPHHASQAGYQPLQPLTLPPPSLDLPPTASGSSSSPSSVTKARSRTPPSRSLLALGSTIASSAGDQTTSPDEGDITVESPSEVTVADELANEQESGLLNPPDNFAMVYPAVYRSSFPSKKHYSFLRSLGLKTVLTLVQDEYPEQNRQFFESEGIAFHQIGIPGNKEPFVSIPDEKIRTALSLVLDARNHPILIHCNKGKHRTGCLVGCLRKMQCWSSTAIFEEYRKFSFPKSRAMDQLFIELFQPDWGCIEHQFLPAWCLGEDGGGSPGLLSPAKPKR